MVVVLVVLSCFYKNIRMFFLSLVVTRWLKQQIQLRLSMKRCHRRPEFSVVEWWVSLLHKE